MSLFDDLAQKFSKTNSEHIGQAIELMVNSAILKRRYHERRWFDNNFFDDGLHFRVVSKRTGRIIDHISYANGYVERAIPRASRQIRGVSNLLFAAEPYPVIYPERITIEDFRDPKTGQIDVQAYQKRMEEAKQVARRQGNWVATQWDELDLPLKLIDMSLLSAKNSISYIQVYSDTEKEQIKTWIGDAFDIVTYGDRRELDDEPFITKIEPMDLVDVFTNPLFDPKKVKELKPDNRYATSEIKDAYMRSRYGNKTPEQNGNDGKGSILIKETFMKEVLTDDNWKQAVKMDTGGALEGKSKGDMVMRHVFSGGGITLRDEYIDYDKYPFAEFRYEPGLLYQTPFIERFIPQNKSIDVVVTRLEKFINAMVVGVYQKRKGENFQISNFPGGQVMEYETTPLTQMNIAGSGATPFNVIELLNKYIDEQGVTTAGGINIPQGVKSGVAIESVKATEYASLKISTLMMKKTIKRITELMLERAAKDFMEPHEVSFIEDGEPKYFDVMGERGMVLSQKVKKDIPNNIIPLRKDLKVRIEMEPGLGLTMQGKKEAMQQIIDYMIKLALPPPAGVGAIPVDAVKQVTKRFMETFGYGSTQEFMEILDAAPINDVTEDSILKMKVAIIEALRDSGAVGPEMEGRLVDSTKLGVLETLKETGLLNKQEQPQPKSLAESLSIAFKDLPEDTKAEVIQALGFKKPQVPSPQGTEQIVKHEQVSQQKEMSVQQSQLAEKKLQTDTAVKMKAMEQKKDSYPISKFRKSKGG